ncbi:CsgG/HfaB family protein [Myroides sp. LJL110]
MRIIFIGVMLLGLTLSGCGAYMNQPVSKKHARIGEVSSQNEILKNLPKPAEPVVAGVYNFRDQTGQYKNIEIGSSFSTAVSQGGTTMLIKALEDSGWFTVVERENLSNLLNERNIIQTTREQFKRSGEPSQIHLPPLLFAGILLEGGVISYDTNIITGGTGVRYFGVGASNQYREDRLTVYLRAVSTTNGKILKTVYVSKTILSQAVSANLFRYVNFQRLLEVETGFTTNEPVHLAMKEAIEKAVEGLIIEGIQENLWGTQQGKDLDNALVQDYNYLKNEQEATELYDRKKLEQQQKNSVELSAGTTVFDGDIRKKKPGYLLRLAYNRSLNQTFDLGLGVNFFELKAGNGFSNQLYSFDANIKANILPYDRLTPFVYAGVGVIGDYYMFDNKKKDNEKFYFKLQYGLGLSYRINSRFTAIAFGEQNLTFNDQIEGIKQGKRDDFYFNFALGLRYHF